MDKPFTTDGCSGSLMCMLRLYWRMRHHAIPPWEVHCVAHDKAYWPGGTASERVAADIALITEINKLGYPFLARLVFIGICIGGVWWLPFGWRWGYGWKYPRRYQVNHPDN